MNATIIKLALAGGVLWWLARKAHASNACAGVNDWEPCGPGRACIKGKCLEMVRCADSPSCRDGVSNSVGTDERVEQVTTWFEELGGWGKRFLDEAGTSLNAASEKIVDYGNAIVSPSDPRINDGPITDPNDPRLGQ